MYRTKDIYLSTIIYHIAMNAPVRIAVALIWCKSTITESFKQKLKLWSLIFDQLEAQELRAKTEQPCISWFLNQTTESLYEIKIRSANMLLVFFTNCSSWSLPWITTVSEENSSRDWKKSSRDRIAEFCCHNWHFCLYKIKGEERKMPVEKMRSKWKRSERENAPLRVLRKRSPKICLGYMWSNVVSVRYW